MSEEVRNIVEALRVCPDPKYRCCGCPVYVPGKPCQNELKAADLIESLSEQLEQATRERDAAIKGLHGDCWECAHSGNWEVCTDCVHFSPLDDYGKKDNWQWRGAQSGLV